jgi:hypothetical protein
MSEQPVIDGIECFLATLFLRRGMNRLLSVSELDAFNLGGGGVATARCAFRCLLTTLFRRRYFMYSPAVPSTHKSGCGRRLLREAMTNSRTGRTLFDAAYARQLRIERVQGILELAESSSRFLYVSVSPTRQTAPPFGGFEDVRPLDEPFALVQSFVRLT